jgi:AAA15 family ATPase/GTPase
VYIKSAKINNYKGFKDSGWFSLSPNVSVIVGKNNSGKTAILEALSLQYSASPHRSPEIPQKHTLPEKSEINLTISILGKELRELIADSNKTVYLPLLESIQFHDVFTPLINAPKIDRQVEKIFEMDDLGFKIKHNGKESGFAEIGINLEYDYFNNNGEIPMAGVTVNQSDLS